MPTARLSFLFVLPLAIGCDGGGAAPTEQAAAGVGPVAPAPGTLRSEKPGPEAQAAYDRARSLYRGGDGPAALAEARRAVALAPGWLEARMQLGKLLLTLSEVNFGTVVRERTMLKDALDELRRAAELAPDDPEAAFWVGHAEFTAARFAAARFAEAIPELERALALNPGHAQATKELGLSYAAEGNAPEAKRVLLRARELLPRDDEVLFQLGLQLEDADDVPGAITAFVEAARMNPAHPGPRTRLVSLYQRQGDAAAAQRAADDLARCKEVAKRLAQGTQRAEENPRDAAAFVEVGGLYFELGMLDAARSWAERALRIDPQNGDAKALLRSLRENHQVPEGELRAIAPSGSQGGGG